MDRFPGGSSSGDFSANGKAVILTRAPYRIPLGGGGTDLPSYYGDHGGFVVSVAINKYLYIALNRPAADDLIRLKYSRYEQVADLEDLEHDLVKPALRLLGLTQRLEIASLADIPAGTGLGSSGTYLVALLLALREMQRSRQSTQELAEEACHIEIDLAGHPSGKQDQYLAAFGGFTCLQIAHDGQVAVEPLRIDERARERLGRQMLVYYTGMTRSSSRILAAQKSDTERKDPRVLASLHRTKALGLQIRSALEAGDVDGFGELLHEHWMNKKLRSANIGGGELDQWYDLARRHGALGGKVMGAGGGGFFAFVCPEQSADAIRNVLTGAGLRQLPYDFDDGGAKMVANF